MATFPTAIVGAGAVASALAEVLAAADFPLVLWARRQKSAETLARRVRARATADVSVAADLGAALRAAPVALFFVSDDALAEVAARAADALAEGPLPIALHASGFHGPEVLEPLRARGAAVASLHPLFPLPRRANPESAWAGAWFVASGDDDAIERGLAIVAAAGGRALVRAAGDPASKRLYHAGAALLSNGAIALFDAALACFEASGFARDEASLVLADLLAATLGNLRSLGHSDALTGPAARGDADVVAGHLRELDRVDPELSHLYRTLTARMLQLAVERGDLPTERAQRVRAALAAGEQ